MTPITLNSSQNSALDAMTAFVSGDFWAFTLLGYAGTGKTSTIQRLVPILQRMGKAVAFSAPTHKAVKVLAAMARKEALDVPCSTIHSLLALKLAQRGEREVIEQDAKGKLSAQKYQVIVVDECSMVGEDLFRHIKRAARMHDIKFIFMGDPAQLPPVGETASATLGLPGAALDEIMRQRGEHPILGLCSDIRASMATAQGSLPAVMPDSRSAEIGLHVMAGAHFEHYMPAAFSHDNFDADPDRFRVIAWTNRAVSRYNRMIQAMRYPDLDRPFAVGEPIVFSKPAHLRSQVGLERTHESGIRVTTELEGICFGCQAGLHPVYQEMRCWQIEIALEDGSSVEVWVLDHSAESSWQAFLSQLAACAKGKVGQVSWADYYRAKEAFSVMRPAYAMTAHKAQGSTFENVFVDMLDIWKNPTRSEALQCLYVACSRASHHLIVNSGGNLL